MFYIRKCTVGTNKSLEFVFYGMFLLRRSVRSVDGGMYCAFCGVVVILQNLYFLPIGVDIEINTS